MIDHRRNVQRTGVIMVLAVFVLVLTITVTALADGETRNATGDERKFHDKVINVLIRALPAGPAGWDLAEEKGVEELQYVGLDVEELPFGVDYYIGWKDTKTISERQDEIMGVLEQQDTASADESAEVDWEAFEELQMQFAEAVDKGDWATAQTLQERMERTLSGMDETLSGVGQSREDIIRELTPKDVRLLVRIFANPSGWWSFEPGQRVAPIMGSMAFREEGRFRNTDWLTGVTYVFLGDNWSCEDDYYVEVEPILGTSYLKVQSVLVEIHGEESRVDDYVERMDWGALKGLLNN